MHDVVHSAGGQQETVRELRGMEQGDHKAPDGIPAEFVPEGETQESDSGCRAPESQRECSLHVQRGVGSHKSPVPAHAKQKMLAALHRLCADEQRPPPF